MVKGCVGFAVAMGCLIGEDGSGDALGQPLFQGIAEPYFQQRARSGQGKTK
jgi:hypothetical protein